MKTIKITARFIPKEEIEQSKKQSLNNILNFNFNLIASSEGILLVANDIQNEKLNELFEKLNHLPNLILKEINIKIN